MTKLEINHLTKIIQKSTVLREISLCMSAPTVYGLQGINGSGKTMLMRAMLGFIRPTEGTVIINGKLLGKEIDFPESVGFLLENPAFLDHYSGYQNLQMIASLMDDVKAEEIYELLDLVGLDSEAAKKKYRKYSLGMKQRLGIAAALLGNPEMIILDEPTNALDTEGVELVKKIIKIQKERGALVIVSCHDFAILKEFSDVIVKMEKGRIISQTPRLI